MNLRDRLYRFIFAVRPKEFGGFLIWMFAIKRIVRRVNGIFILVNPATQAGIETAKSSQFSDRLVKSIEELPKHGTFIDLGANEGLYSLIASGVMGRAGRVYAIEPQERLWPIILKNAALNQFFNIRVVPYAVGNNEGLEEITLMPATNTGSSGLVKGASLLERFRAKQSVRIVKLDRLVTEFGLEAVELLKVDVEGFEYSVLESGRESLSKHVFKRIMVEIHDEQLRRLGVPVTHVQEILEQYHYKCETTGRYLFAHI
jgi:FkbM family methyltransferase